MGREQQDSTLLGSPHLGFSPFPAHPALRRTPRFCYSLHIFVKKAAEQREKSEDICGEERQVQSYLCPLEQKVLPEAPTRISVPVDDQGWKTGRG